MTARRTWPLAIGGLLIGNVIAMVILAVVANDGGTQVIPAYYDRAAHFDDEMSRASASRALGWHAEVAIAAGAIDVTVSDAAGHAVDGARVRVTGYQRAHSYDGLGRPNPFFDDRTGTPLSASFRIPTIWVSLNFDFRMTAPDPEQSTFQCQSIGEAYAPVRVRATFTGKGRDIFCVEGLKMLLAK